MEQSQTGKAFSNICPLYRLHLLDRITNNVCTYDVLWFQVLGSEVIVIEESVEDDISRTATDDPTQISPKVGTAANLGIKAVLQRKTDNSS